MGTEVYIGREAERAVLAGLVDGVAAGRGGVVLIEGEAGIGKSALIGMGLGAAGERGCTIARGAGDQLSGRFPLRVMLDLLGIESRATDPRRARIAAVLRGEAGGELEWSHNPTDALTEALLGLVEQLCADAPLVLAVDDFQWVDDPTLRLVRRLVRLVEQMPLLLVGAARTVSDRDEYDLLRRDVAERGRLLSLEPLPDPDVVRLVVALHGGEPEPELLRQATAASGNPMWIREVVDAARRGDAPGGPGRPVPTSLVAAVSRRLSFLPSTSSEVLRVAALLGTRFSVLDVCAVLRRSPIDLMGPLGDAMTAGVVVSGEAERLEFRHPLIRESLYESMPGAVRAGLHRQAAQALAEAGGSVQAVAEQLLAAGPGAADGWMTGWLEQNAPVLVNQALDVAVELLRLGLEHTAPDSPRWETLATALARSLFRVARQDDGEAYARMVLDRTADPDRAAEMREVLANIMSRSTRGPEGMKLIEAGLRDGRVTERRRARLLAAWAMQLIFVAGRLDDAEQAAREALALGRRVGDPYAAGSALLWLAGVSSHRGDLVGLLDRLDEGLTEIGDDAESLHIRLILLYNRVVALERFDRLSEAEAALGTVRELAERTGGGTLQRLGQVTAWLHYIVGRWDDALAKLDALTDRVRTPDMAIYTAGVGALIAARRDDPAAAEAYLRSVDQISMDNPVARNNGSLLASARATVAERDGRLDEAVAALAVVVQPEYSVMEDRFLLMPNLVRLALAAGDRALAETAAATCAADGARVTATGPEIAMERCRGLLSVDPEPLLAAAHHYREAGRRSMLGQAWEDAAAALAQQGGRDAEARSALDEALQVYAELEAAWDIRRAEARLRAYGIRRGVRGPRRRPQQGWAALSRTELIVARLVAQGRSNSDIATELLLSRRTVQSHVSHILAKLNARSRIEIARQAVEHRAA